MTVDYGNDVVPQGVPDVLRTTAIQQFARLYKSFPTLTLSNDSLRASWGIWFSVPLGDTSSDGMGHCLQ
jgi:hypothetical protein